VIRLLHFSDVHVQEPFSAMSASEFWSKRALAAGNLFVKRGKYFDHVLDKLVSLAQFAEEQRVDGCICTGDFTAVGSRAEHASSRRAIEPLTRVPLGLMVVPGNHDLYLPDTLADGRFEQHFGDLLKTDLPEYVTDGAYPFVRLLGEDLAVVGVNSSKPNPNPFSSAGHVPEPQLEALGRVLDDPRVRSRFIIVMTHYGILKQNGHPDAPRHGLDNAERLTSLCARPRVMLVHGHIHGRYSHPAAEGRPWLFCSGSTTHMGREGIWLYEWDGGTMRAIPGRYELGGYVLEPENAVQVG
jgi:3',5'-cyclic AMP phosphodiesterase CpdA